MRKINNKLIIGVVVLLLLVGGIVLIKSQYGGLKSQDTASQIQQTAVEPNTVIIKDMAFSPATLTVKVGDKVTWTNKNVVGHSATADDKSFDTGVFGQDKSGSFTFSKAGTYTYHCSVHPGMHGVVIVK